MPINRTAIATYIAIVIITLLALFVIKTLNIAFPLDVRTSTSGTSELAVVGEGKVEVVPDSASVEAGVVVNNADTTQEARQQIDQVNNKIVDAVMKLGLRKEDVKTSNYSINPNYIYEPSGGQGRIAGYNGNVNLSIKVTSTEILPQIIEAVTAAGANNIYNTQYSVEDPAKYREQAREEAIKNARDQAEKLAKSLGIRLGKVVNIVESQPQDGMPIPLMRSEAAMGGDTANVNLQPGSQTITSVVTLYFEKR